MKKSLFILTLLGLSFIGAAAQTPTPAPNPEDDVVKITTSLVQVDAVVTDRDGNQVTDLKAEDFEIMQDDKPQRITSFSYVRQGVMTNSSAPKSNTEQLVPAVANNKNDGTRRILTFIVDDGNCAVSQGGILTIKDALEKFINQTMLPDDLVSIYQTSGGSSLIQQYTSDKTRLLQIVKKIRWLPAAAGCFYGSDLFNNEALQDRREREESASQSTQIVGSIGVMRYIVRGLERVPGRKVVFFMSDGLPINARNGTYTDAFNDLRELADLATRASVIFNTFDIRGVQSGIMIDASADVRPFNPKSPDASGTTGRLIADNTASINSSQNGLYYLAEETGGRFFRNSNLLDGPLKKVLNLEKGFYLIGYEPDDETFRGKKYHKLKIVSKRPELKVYSRTGFIGQTDDQVKPRKRVGDSELYEALVAPLPQSGLNLQLTAFFGNTAQEGSFVRSLVYLGGDDITFIDDPSGYKKAVFDVVAVTLDEKNKVVDEFNRTHTFKVEAAAVPFIKKNGLIYSTDVPVKKAGTYNFRIAIRDAASRTIGTASQVLKVPELGRRELFLSGLTVSQVDAAGKFPMPSAVKPENALSMTASAAVPSIRRFKPGMILAYAYSLYNAHPDQATGQPKLEVQMNLYRDGKMLLEGKSEPLTLDPRADWTKIDNFEYFRINNLEPDDYVLQIVIKDLISKETVSQWVDFEVTN
ncbi:MAG: VWA domain-containing protein [Acidobacteria bacterium]|nr:VWA domain-containing protein [Acidobacteriota bacterium]